MSWSIVEPVIDLSVRFLCLQRYPGHKKGCPNYERKSGCPPYTPTIDQLIDLQLPVWAIWNVFDFAGHCQRMRVKHPRWSKRQIECCLYWQPKARKELKDEVKKFLSERTDKIVVWNPEGAGVNVTATMKSVGMELEWPPVTKTYQIVLAGTSIAESEGA